MSTLPPGQVTRQGWEGYPFPPDVQRDFLNRLLTGSPFAAALANQPTTSGTVVWPMVSPEGAAWVAEMQEFPDATLNDEAYVVAVCKLGTIITLSNESVDDSSFNLAQAVGRRPAGQLWPAG